MASHAVALGSADGVGPVGGVGSLSFDVDFDAGLAINEFFLFLGDTTPVLPLLSGTVTWNGLDLSDPSVPAALADPFTWGPNFTGGLTFSTEALTGLLHFTYTYDLSALSLGQSASVDFSFQYYDDATNDYPVLTQSATVTAVPEAQAWALALGGLSVAGVLGTLRARRSPGEARLADPARAA